MPAIRVNVMGFGLGEDSGRLWIEGDAVRYESKTYGSWRLAIADIRIIGEATNQNGPCADDYFICFVTDAGGCWSEASYYAAGCIDCLVALAARLGDELELQLHASADFASRILWPPHLVGQLMFSFTDNVSRGVWQRLKSLIFPRNTQTLSEIVLAEVQHAK